jgi:hypothetical protein
MNALLECPICRKLLCQPLTTQCGHTFCRSCLDRALRRNRKECPACGCVCHLEPSTHFESKAVSSIATFFFPKEYALREAELDREKETWDLILPMYSCNDVVLPYSTINAHMFEERYKVMARGILDTSRRFCYLVDQPQDQVFSIACSCEHDIEESMAGMAGDERGDRSHGGDQRGALHSDRGRQHTGMRDFL